MNDHDPRTLGLRQNNPLWFREFGHPNLRVPHMNGMRHYPDMHTGCEAVFYFLNTAYRHFGLRTLRSLAGHVACERDVNISLLESDIAKRLGMSLQGATTTDLFLDRPWRALDMARVLIHCINGPAPAAAPYMGEWIAPAELVNAMVCTGKWGGL